MFKKVLHKKSMTPPASTKVLVRCAAVVLATAISVTALTGCGDKKAPTTGGGTSKQATTATATAKPNTDSQQKADDITNDVTKAKTVTPAPSINAAANVSSALSEAKSFAAAGMYSDAAEVMADVDRSKLSSAEKQEYDQLNEEISSGKAKSENVNFEPNAAIDALNAYYGLTLDSAASDGLALQYGEDGRAYYELSVQLDDQNAIVTARVYSDGTIEEVSRRSKSVG